MIDIYETFVKLQAAARPSGFERPCAQLIAQLAAPYCDETRIDVMGNVICHKKGPGKRVMTAAHMDTIGLMITHIDEKGFLRFNTLGGFAPYRLATARMKLENGCRGVVFLGEIKIGDLYLDVGARSREEAERLVSIGDVAVYEGEPLKLGDRIASPYCDDLIACAAQLSAMSQMEQSENDLYFVFTVQEETGLRGARTAAYGIDPEYGFCMDVTRTGDTAGETVKMEVKLGGGPAIKIKDTSLLCNPQAVQHLRQAAEEAGLAYQDEVLTAGGTDSAAMQQTRAGVLAGCVSIPCRYIHSQHEMISLKDAEDCARLLARALQTAL